MKIKLERLKTSAGRKWLSTKLDRPVRIIGEGWYWKKNRAGYTDQKESAGIYLMGDAWNASAHCGEEKRIVYEFLKEGTPTQEPMGKAHLLLKAV